MNMNKAILLLTMLSVYAISASDKAEEKGQELQMEQIKSLDRLKFYSHRVIALTASQWYLYEDMFTLEDQEAGPESVVFGVIEFEQNDRENSMNVAWRRFRKMNAVDGLLCLIRERLNKKRPMGGDSWTCSSQKFFEDVDLKVRWATDQEKGKLKKALLGGEIKFDYSSSEERALSYLDNEA